MGSRISAILCALLLVPACQRRDQEELPASRAPSPQSSTKAAPPALPNPSTAPSPYDVPRRSDEEFRTLARQRCEESVKSGRPLLLEAGADWCGDCRLVHRLRASEPLKTELLNWQTLDVNLGEDQQEWLRSAFRIKAIARWFVFRPTDCGAPMESWSPIASRVVEPTSGGDDANGAFLASWLGRARRAPVGP